MRIIAGKAKRMELSVPRGRIRPMTDRLRGILFSWLSPHLAGASVLDLFAGTGSLGLEALSRGASRAVFVERDRSHARSLRSNVAGYRRIDPDADVSVKVMGYRQYLQMAARRGEQFDIVFVDPPFRTDLLTGALSLLSAGEIVPAGGIVACQREAAAEADLSGFETARERRSGNNLLFLLRRA